MQDSLVTNFERPGRLSRAIKRMLGDYRWIHFYLQRYLTLNTWFRSRVASLAARMLPHSSPFQPSAEARAIAAQLDECGVAPLPGLLTASETDDIVRYLRTRPCYDPRHPEMPGFLDPKDAHSSCYHAYYTADDIAHAPHLLAIANRPVVLEAVEAVLGCKPTISAITIHWLLNSYDYSDSEANNFRYNAKTFHRDVDDWAQIKLFIYLTDVDANSAPHTCLKESHKSHIADGEMTMDVETARRLYPGKVHMATGPAGTAFLENTFALHVGGGPKSRNRLLVAFAYTLFSLPFANIRQRPRNLDMEPNAIDPYASRLWLAEPPAIVT